MGLMFICQCCGAPCGPHTFSASYNRICLQCDKLFKAGMYDTRVHRALGALKAYGSRQSVEIKLIGEEVDRCAEQKAMLKAKAKALIEHDRILRGEK